ncbi:MAG: purine-binding chemotaxis protein CheW [Halanaerobiaceae bacterium]|jgi:purine-binding chemotaxis protein CheW|nr:purine-binding chemotaxis protein CheW [Halanaerobiaceae bacterium]
MLSNFQDKKRSTFQREEKQFIVFSIGEEKFGVDVSQIKQIIPVSEYTLVPNAPSFVRGVIDLRGDIIPIVNLKSRLALKGIGSQAKEPKIIIVELDNNIIGMEVDSVSEMIRVYLDEINEAPDIVKGINRDYLYGVTKWGEHLLILLDLGKILSKQEISELDKIDI